MKHSKPVRVVFPDREERKWIFSILSREVRLHLYGMRHGIEHQVDHLPAVICLAMRKWW